MPVTADDVKKVFAGVVPADVLDKLDPALPMVGQGIDSLSLTALAVALQKAYGVLVTPEDAVNIKTLNDVAAFLSKAQAKA